MSKTVAIASRQRDWRTRAKSRIERRGNRSKSPASCTRRASPSPDQEAPSTTRRSDASSTSSALADPSGGSPGHQSVTGRSWTRSGVTTALRCWPVAPPAVRKISSEQASGAPGRGSTQCASTRPSSQGGPSGSADSTMSVREGCRPVSRPMVAAARAPSSAFRAMTTRFCTDVRAATARVPPDSCSRRKSGCAQIRASSFSMASMDVACDCQRIVGSPGRGGSSSSMRPPPAPREPTARISPTSRLGAPSVLRSGATGSPRAPAGHRPPPAPRCPPRSSAGPAPAPPPRR